MFNYIITIHNKGFILERVLRAVERNASKDAVIIPVLDGCSDDSEAIVKRLAKESSLEYRIVYAKNVHEILSINEGLKVASPGFCFILQDDVILSESGIEQHTLRLWEKYGRNVGYISYRMGCSIGKGRLWERIKLIIKSRGSQLGPFLGEFDHVAGPADHFDGVKTKIGYYEDRIVDAVIKSPVCLTPALRELAFYLDERLAPYCYDDFDMSLIALRNGLVNILMPFPVQSELEWGGTRKDPSFNKQAWRIMARNRAYLMRKHSEYFDAL